MHPIREFSRFRRLMLCSACALAFAGAAEARTIVPEKPSVEVNFNALRELQPSTYLPAPPAPTSPYDVAPMQRQVPSQQYAPATPAPAPKPAVPRAPKPAPKPVAKPAPAPEPTLPPPPAPTVVPEPVAPAPVAPAPSLPSIPEVPQVNLPPIAPVATPSPTTAPVPAALPPVTTPVVQKPQPSPTPAQKPVPAPRREPPKPAAKVAAPKPATVPVPEAKPALPPVAPAIVAPTPTVAAPAAPVIPPTLPSIPVPDAAPANVSLPPMPTGGVNVPPVATIRSGSPSVPPAPDISGLNFSKLPTAKPATAPVPLPPVKKDDALPLAPITPATPALPAAPKPDTGPLLIPVPKPPAPLPPSVTERLDALGAPVEKKEGILSDKTTVKDVAAEKKAKADAEAKLRADQQAAAAALKKQQLEAEAAAKKARDEEAAKAKADADAKLKAETDLVAAKKAAEDKAKADAEAAKKAATPMPPATLPSLPSIPTMPDPLAKSAEPVKLDPSKIGALPKMNNAAAPATPAPAAPVLPAAPSTAPSNPNLPKLPTLTIPGTQADKPLPSLTAITGEGNPTTADIMQPKDAVDSVPLPPANAAPMPPVLPPIDEGVATVQRELPEVNVGNAPVAPKPDLPVVKFEKPATAPALPSIPPAPTVTPKTDTPVAVASTPAVNTSGNLETSIVFGNGSSALGDKEKATLTGIAEKARKSNKKVRIVGYSSGDADKAAVARKTAFARANIIRAFLLSKGMSDAMIHAQALGNQVAQDKADIFLQ